MRTQHTNHGAFLGATQQTLFQLPPPPPGMQWHRTDGWQEGDLPQGTRPLFLGEPICEQIDEWKQVDENSNTWVKRSRVYPDECTGAQARKHSLHRTRRPLTFTHAGKTWTWHRPGDPMPCNGERRVEVLFGDRVSNVQPASYFFWDESVTIIGWRYADEKKTVRLGPEDVPPGSVIRGQNWALDWSKCWLAVRETTPTGVHCNRGDEYLFTSLQFGWQINRSIPLTGKWNPDAWEPCSKEVLA